MGDGTLFRVATMANSKYAANTAAARARRIEAGAYVRSLRLKQNLTQLDLANKLGFAYYTFVSQVECGKSRIPPDRMLDWANHLGVDGQLFSRKMLKFYDPHMFQAIFPYDEKLSVL